MRLPQWKQNTPKLEAIALTGAIEGWVSNLEDGCSTPERVASAIQPLLDELKVLHATELKEQWGAECEAWLLLEATLDDIRIGEIEGLESNPKRLEVVLINVEFAPEIGTVQQKLISAQINRDRGEDYFEIELICVSLAIVKFLYNLLYLCTELRSLFTEAALGVVFSATRCLPYPLWKLYCVLGSEQAIL